MVMMMIRLKKRGELIYFDLYFSADIVKKIRRVIRDEINREVIGCMVLTRYNNKTYRIDDIKWDENPLSTFDSFNGDKVSFCDYYK